MEEIIEHKCELEGERSRIMDLMVKEHVWSMEEQREQREHINSMHRMKSLEERYKDISQKLRELQTCDDILKDSEMQEDSDPQAVKDFCSQLETLIECHCHGLRGNTVSMPIKYVDSSADLVHFTEEEGNGRYLDLRECHQHYMTLKDIGKVDYATYVSTFDHLFDIPKERKDAKYCRYIKSILDYLNCYLSRVAPLQNINREMRNAELEFEAQWRNGTFPGWLENPPQSKAKANLELSTLSSWSGLKSSLADLESKCDEPIDEDVQGVVNKSDEDKLHLISLVGNRDEEIRKTKEIAKHKKVAALEAMVYRLLDLASIQRVATIEKVQKMQSRITREHGDADYATSHGESRGAVV